MPQSVPFTPAHLSEDGQHYPKSITPLTIKQILRVSQLHNHKKAEKILDGRQLNFVQCIGNLLSIEERGDGGSKLRYLKIEDGTARFLRVFVHEDKGKASWDTLSQLLEEEKIKAGKYVRVVGWVDCSKDWGNSISAKYITPIEDAHQIFFHLLECAVVAKKWEEEQSKQNEEADQHASEVSDNNEAEGNESREQPRPTSRASTEESSDDNIKYASENSNDEDSSDEEHSEAEHPRPKSSSSSSDDEEDQTMHANANVSEASASVPGGSKSASLNQELQCVQATLDTLSLTRSLNNNVDNTEHTASTSKQQLSTSVDPLSQLSNIQRALVLHIQQRREDTCAEGEEDWVGLHISELVRVIQRHDKYIDKFGVSNALEMLMEEGILITTIDETHFDVADL